MLSDHIKKPVLSLDVAGRITGVGEYDPFGSMNRVQLVAQSDHPYSRGAASATYTTLQQKQLGGMNVRFRAHLPMVDTEQDCYGTVREGIGVWNAAATTLYETVGGYARGDVWTNWWLGDTVSGSSVLKLGWGLSAGNCDPTACGVTCPQASGSGWQYSGFVLREYEYSRYEVGATPYFPPLRFPGQYWDPETDLNENWHRYYGPFIGRYLSPEPMLRDPSWVRSEAHGGFPVPTYSYARNNPLRYTDLDGLSIPPPDPGEPGRVIRTESCFVTSEPASDCGSGYARVLHCFTIDCPHKNKDGSCSYYDPRSRKQMHYRVRCLPKDECAIPT